MTREYFHCNILRDNAVVVNPQFCHDRAQFTSTDRHAPSTIAKLSHAKYPAFRHHHCTRTPQPQAPTALCQKLARTHTRRALILLWSAISILEHHCLMALHLRYGYMDRAIGDLYRQDRAAGEEINAGDGLRYAHGERHINQRWQILDH